MDTKSLEKTAKGIAHGSSPYRTEATVCAVAAAHCHRDRRRCLWWVLIAFEPWWPGRGADRNPKWVLTRGAESQEDAPGLVRIGRRGYCYMGVV
jgi:hypothetical protein